MKIRRAVAVLAVAGGLATIPGAVDAGHRNANATYRVTIENMSTGFQPMSPAGAVVHSKRTDVWSVGYPASAGVAAVAEDANLPIFVDTYDGAPGVKSAFIGGEMAFGPGGSTEFTFDARKGDRLSLVSMLVNTNDAFTGLDAVRLGNHTEVYYANVYDAGTEINNEDGAFIPGPAGTGPLVRAPEGAVISHHAGVLGGADLDPEVHGWDEPVARITIEKIG
jgi:hypothetical protein